MISSVIGICPVAGRREPLTGGDCWGYIAALEHMPMLSMEGINHQKLLVCGIFCLGTAEDKRTLKSDCCAPNRLHSICTHKIMGTVALSNF